MKTILVAYDFTSDSQFALNQAVKIAEKFDADLWLLHVAPPEPEFVGFKAGPGVVRKQVAVELRNEHRALQKAAADIGYDGITPILAQGAIVETVLSQADRLDVDLIVVGAGRRNKLETIVFGSISKSLLQEANRSVLVCR